MPTFFIAPTTHATTPGHDTTGTGTSLLPWLTLTKANASSVAGDTVILKNGTYTWSSIGHMTSIRLYRSETVNGAILDGADGNFGMLAGIFPWDGVGSVSAIGIVFQNVRRTAASGVSVFSCASGALGILSFQNCTFRRLAAAGTDAFAANRGGIFWGEGAALNVTFDNCLFDDCFSHTGTTGQLFAPLAGTAPCVFSLTNCTFSFRAAAPENLRNVFFVVNSNAAYLTVNLKNNIFSADNGTTVGFFSHLAKASIVASHNLYDDMTNVSSGAGDITGNPIFENPAGANFNLRPTSPAPNKGTLI